MKNLLKINLKYAIFLFLSVVAVSCTDAKDERETTPKRIILKEQTNVNGYHMYIVEVEGREFLVNGRGGIEPLSDCK